MTERKRAEEALEKRRKNTALWWKMPTKLSLIIQDGRFVFVNPRALELSGFSREEFFSRSFLDFVHPDDRLRAVERYQKRMKGEPLPAGFVSRMIDKRGKSWWGYSNAVMIEWEVNLALLALGTDITELKEAEEALRVSEEQYRAVFDNAGIGIDLLDRDGRILRVNQALLDMLGYTEGGVPPIHLPGRHTP